MTMMTRFKIFLQKRANIKLLVKPSQFVIYPYPSETESLQVMVWNKSFITAKNLLIQVNFPEVVEHWVESLLEPTHRAVCCRWSLDYIASKKTEVRTFHLATRKEPELRAKFVRGGRVQDLIRVIRVSLYHEGVLKKVVTVPVRIVPPLQFHRDHLEDREQQIVRLGKILKEWKCPPHLFREVVTPTNANPIKTDDPRELVYQVRWDVRAQRCCMCGITEDEWYGQEHMTKNDKNHENERSRE